MAVLSHLIAMDEINYTQLALSEINNKTKPLGALGQLEAIAVQLATIQQTLKPEVYPARVLVFGADHGVSQQGVSAFPAEVTAQMMANFASGGAAINVIAQSVGASIKVIDVGVNADLSTLSNIEQRKVKYGTQDFTDQPAMNLEECNHALQVGENLVIEAYEQGIKTLALGEMGIGNTTAAAALICAFTGHETEKIVGLGTGINEQALQNKCAVVAKALTLHQDILADPKLTLAALGGLEIAALTGAILRACELGIIVVIDGFISTAAALTACQINSEVLPGLIFSHQSAEQGHKLALEFLKAVPVLKLELRLGEGTGATLALPILKAAANILSDMATFEQAGVSGKND